MKSGRPQTVFWPCPHYGEKRMTGNGVSRTGHTQFFCQNCKRYVIEGAGTAVSKMYTAEQKAEALRLMETLSRTEVSRTLNVGMTTLGNWWRASGGQPRPEGRPRKKEGPHE